VESEVLRAPHILVWGFIGKGNLGDDLFQDAFKALFPHYQFTFTDCITAEQVLQADMLWIGGGSLLDGPIVADMGVQYHSLPVMYIGVGTETAIHPDHQLMLYNALLVATRTKDTTFSHPNLMHIPDLVYALKTDKPSAPVLAKNKILFLPNAYVVPNHKDQHWKHSAWQFFKSEVAQMLDECIVEGHQVAFYAMCQNDTINDVWAAAEIRNMMCYRAQLSTYQARSYHQAINLFEQFSHVITQRYHGIVLAEIAGRPVVSIHHHDKLRGESSVPYYGLLKRTLKQALNSATVRTDVPNLSSFQALITKVSEYLGQPKCAMSGSETTGSL